jgi:integrase
MEELYDAKDLSNLDERVLHDFFGGMRNGTILRIDGIPYKAPVDYVKIFKAFWHWYQKVSRKKGFRVEDITVDLDTSKDKPEWVYLTEKQFKKLCNEATYEYRVLFMFLFDTGIRAPTELMNIKVSDFYNDFKELNIRDEISKTFGRRIKLMLSSDFIKDYIESRNLEKEDFLFTKKPCTMNQYIQRLSKRLFGEEKSLAGEKYSKLTLYDFRHISCCYWLPRYKSESGLKFRFGWKKSEKIHYYSELLGMSDTITEGDLILDEKKNEIEKELAKTRKEKDLMQEQIISVQDQFGRFVEVLKKLNIPEINNLGII